MYIVLWTLLALSVILILCVLGYAGMGMVFLCSAFRRSKGGIPEAMLPKPGETPEEQENARIIRENRKLMREKADRWLGEASPEELTVKSGDGLTLHAELIRAEGGSHRYSILCHGYMGDRTWMEPYAAVYGMWGWNTLVLDMRSHGASEGKWYGMGWKDKDDLLVWIREIVRMDPEAEIVLHGVSMGGASVMMASGLEGMPSNLKAVIDDCGYTNVWRVFRETIPEKALTAFRAASRMNSIINGWWFQYGDALSMIRKAPEDLPMLFMQGADDKFVKLHMTEEAYAAKRGIREKRIFPDTDHGSSYVRHPEEYFGTVKAFLEKYVG